MVKVSTVIPIYDVEEYLEETIRGVISQDIGFEERCELILVNDGSPDGSGEICEKYAQKYPDNIKYIKQPNAGVSAARNNGLKHASGEYVHFLDSDDIISKDAYSKTVALLDANKGKIDLAAFRVEFFDGQLGEHPLNHKFSKGTRVIDLKAEPDAVIVHVSSCLIRRSNIVSDFDASIKISEDMKFLAEQVTQRMAYGVVVGPTYYYRKRKVGGSAMDTARQKKHFYTVTPSKVYQYLFDSLKKSSDGSPNIYAQYAAAYDLQWRLRQPDQAVLTDEEEAEYIQTIKALIRQIDDKVLLGQGNFTVAQLDYIFSIKYDSKKYPKIVEEALRARAHQAKPSVFIEFIGDLGNGRIRVEGRIPNASRYHDLRLIDDTGHATSLTFTDYVYRRVMFLSETVSPGYVFSVEVGDVGSLSFKNFDNILDLVTRRQSKIPNARFGYRLLAGRIVKNQIHKLDFISYRKYRHFTSEFMWIVRIICSLHLMESLKRLRMVALSTRKRSIRPLDVIGPVVTPIRRLGFNLVSVLYRLMYRIYRPSRQVWIVSDRPFAAGDNGEAFYSYVNSQENKSIYAYFAIHKNSSDCRRLQQVYPRVIDSSSLRYKLLFLKSSKVISSQADDVVVNPFGMERVEHLYDLYSFDFIFLQHGIIRNDMSRWLNRYNKNISLFVTSAEKERESILTYDYAYSSSTVVLTGLPRFDLLENSPRKKIIIMPTWRRVLVEEAQDDSGQRLYNPEFTQSGYYKFYSSLLSSRKLMDALDRYGYIAEFYLHPLLSQQSIDFEGSGLVRVMKPPYDYQKAFKEGSLLVTDYSSVFFDFAYLRKPVVYTQFDTDTYYQDVQMYTKGYMDDSRDGFGPVVYTHGEAVKSIVAHIEAGCQMEDLYKERVERFFRWHDKSNRRRVYEAVLGLD